MLPFSHSSFSPASGWRLAKLGSSPLQRVVFPRVDVPWLVAHGSSGVSRALVLVEMRQPPRLAWECFWQHLPLELHGRKDVALPGHCLRCQGQQLALGRSRCRPQLRGYDGPAFCLSAAEEVQQIVDPLARRQVFGE